MYLLLSIILSIILGYALLMMGPLVGGLLAFGIVAGILFRGLYFLNEIHKRITKDEPKPDTVKETYETYIRERENKSQA